MVEDFMGLTLSPKKPRERGLNHVIDKGMTLRDVEAVLESAGDYIDLVKLGWGTSYVTADLGAKVRLYHDVQAEAHRRLEDIYAKL